MKEVEALTRIMARLRGPRGCPWDQKQTHRTLRPMLLEEVYELLEAIDQKDDHALEEELTQTKMTLESERVNRLVLLFVCACMNE